MAVYNGDYASPGHNEWLHGRVNIYSSTDAIDQENILKIVNEALSRHNENLYAEEYLYGYRRGITPILYREKKIRPEINNKLSESSGIAGSIVDFKSGYFLTQPAFYTARTDGVQEKVDLLNEYLYRSGKHIADNATVNWFHTVGLGVMMVEVTEDDDVPVRVYALDPRSAFVVKSMRPGNRPIIGISAVVADKSLFVDAFTERYVFRLSGGIIEENKYPNVIGTVTDIISVERNQLGRIPIIEYRYNAVNMGAFENCVSLLDAIDVAQSNRVDGIEQKVQGLIVTYNCRFADDADSTDLREQGIVNLTSTGELHQDIKVLDQELDQTSTQVLVDDLYTRIMTMCSMPFASGSGNSTSDTGSAVLARAGWYQAETAARNTEDLFRESNRYFDEIFVDILRRKGKLDVSTTDFELNFVRNETSNIQSKAQAFNTLLAAGLNPELAAAKSGISNDPVSDIAMSEKYLKMRWGDPNEQKREAEENAEDNEEDPQEIDVDAEEDNADAAEV